MLAPLSDHDILTIHTEQLHTVCNMLKNNQDTLSQFIGKIDIRCEVRRNEILTVKENSMTTGAFWKILTVLVIILLAIISTAGFNRTLSVKNEIQIGNNAKMIEKNSVMMKTLLERIPYRQ